MADNGKLNANDFVEGILKSIGKKDAFSRVERLVHSTPVAIPDGDLIRIKSSTSGVLSSMEQRKKWIALISIIIGVILLVVGVIIAASLLKIGAEITPTATALPEVTEVTEQPTPTEAPTVTLEPTPAPVLDCLVEDSSLLPVPPTLKGNYCFATTLQQTIITDPGLLGFRITGTCNAAKCKIRTTPIKVDESNVAGAIDQNAELPVLGKSQDGLWVLVNNGGTLAWTALEIFKVELTDLEKLAIVEGTQFSEYTWTSNAPMEVDAYSVYLLDTNRKNLLLLSSTFEIIDETQNATPISIVNTPGNITIGTVEVGKPNWAYAGMFKLEASQQVKITIKGFVPDDEAFQPQLLLVQIPEESANTIVDQYSVGNIALILDNNDMVVAPKWISGADVQPTINPNDQAWNGSLIQYQNSVEDKLELRIVLPDFTAKTNLYIHLVGQEAMAELPNYVLLKGPSAVQTTLTPEVAGQPWQLLGEIPANCDCKLQITFKSPTNQAFNLDALMFVAIPD
jgi:hypothetical protein